MKRFWQFLYQMASPARFCVWVDRLLVPCLLLCGLALTYGLIGGLFLSPPDYQQGDAFRIIYIHVPSAFLSLMAYGLLSFCSVLTLVWGIKMADTVHAVTAPLGALFTGIALFTGAVWGKPMWGTWWIWDARLTSELILLFLYLAIIGLRQTFSASQHVSRSVSLFTLVGFVDIPLFHYSVNWWNTLHQGATLSAFANPKMASVMLYPLLSMLLSFVVLFTVLVLYRTRTQLLWQHRKSRWVGGYVQQQGRQP